MAAVATAYVQQHPVDEGGHAMLLAVGGGR